MRWGQRGRFRSPQDRLTNGHLGALSQARKMNLVGFWFLLLPRRELEPPLPSSGTEPAQLWDGGLVLGSGCEIKMLSLSCGGKKHSLGLGK